MGGEGFKIDPADLVGAAPTFKTQSEILRTAYQAWWATMSRVGQPWGNDEQGQKFANGDNGHNGIVAAQDCVFKALEVLVQGIASMDPALRALADNTVDRDQANADMYR
jgi:hypothetical protein